MLGALVNAVFLVALCFSITVESLKRFYDPEDIHDPQERNSMVFILQGDHKGGRDMKLNDFPDLCMSRIYSAGCPIIR